ncbi:hypothetical protein HD554DRAFT_2027188, partial [Boletus coccyginus]
VVHVMFLSKGTIYLLCCSPGSVPQVVGYIIEPAALPFPAFVLGYAINLNGIGMALQDAQANGFVASLENNAETKMGILHARGTYASNVQSAGALSSLLVATQFAQLPCWSFHYLTSLGIALTKTVLLITVFRLESQEECLAQIGQPVEEQSENDHFRQIFTSKDVHLLAVFTLVCVGIEVTLGGMSFVTALLHATPDSRRCSGWIAR